MEVIQWIFMHEILQNVADNGKLCEKVRYTINCAKMCSKQKIVRRTGNCAISHWPHLNIASLIDTVAYRRSPHCTLHWWIFFNDQEYATGQRPVYHSASGTMLIINLLRETPTQLLFNTLIPDV